jgi:hypothetical protein
VTHLVHLLAGQRASAWLARMPTADCLRCGDTKALLTEYKRLSSLALTVPSKPDQQRLGSLSHLSTEQLRLRDLETILQEYKALQTLAVAAVR